MNDGAYGCFAAIIIALILLVAALGTFNATPWGRGIINSWDYAVQKVDDATNYETRKNVEDTCRAMASSYTADRMTWEQYRSVENEEQRAWADQAMMRANKTAASYNEYILKNSFVWDGNIPKDIKKELSYIKN